MGSAMTLEKLRDRMQIFSRNGTVNLTVEKVRSWIEVLDAHIASQPKWLPIESAPKSVADGRHIDGIYLLGFVPEADAVDLKSCIRIIWWEPLLIGKNGNKGKWVCDAMDVSVECEPTHWMTLTEVPCAP